MVTSHSYSCVIAEDAVVCIYGERKFYPSGRCSRKSIVLSKQRTCLKHTFSPATLFGRVNKNRRTNKRRSDTSRVRVLMCCAKQR